MSKWRRYTIVGVVGVGAAFLIACVGRLLGSLFYDHDLTILVSLIFGGLCGPAVFAGLAVLSDKLKEYPHV